jgi:hypothetical protein
MTNADMSVGIQGSLRDPAFNSFMENKSLIFVPFARFQGVNAPTMADIKLSV